MKPHDQRTPEDYEQAADDSLELAKVVAGQGEISDQAFLETMARSDELVEHDGDTCGMCYNIILSAQVAREMIEAGEYEDLVSKWATETRRRWEESKFFKLWQDEPDHALRGGTWSNPVKAAIYRVSVAKRMPGWSSPGNQGRSPHELEHRFPV